MNSTHKYEQLIEIFDGCFADDFNTRLIKGDDEPIYLPADAEVPYNRSRLVLSKGQKRYSPDDRHRLGRNERQTSL